MIDLKGTGSRTLKRVRGAMDQVGVAGLG
jgi:hypothetical protein